VISYFLKHIKTKEKIKEQKRMAYQKKKEKEQSEVIM